MFVKAWKLVNQIKEFLVGMSNWSE